MKNNPTFVKKTGTGNEQAAAKRFPLSAKDSELVADESTSDGVEVAVTGKRPHHAHEQLEGGEQKRIHPAKLKDAA